MCVMGTKRESETMDYRPTLITFRENVKEKDADREIRFQCEETNYSNGRWFVIGRCCGDWIWIGDVFTALYRIRYPEPKPDFDDDEGWELYHVLRIKEDLREVSLQIVSINLYHRDEENVPPIYGARLELFGEGGELIRQGDMLSTLEIATIPLT